MPQVNYTIEEIDNVPYVMRHITDDAGNVLDSQPESLGTYLKVAGQEGAKEWLTIVGQKVSESASTFSLDPNDPDAILDLAQRMSTVAQNLAAFAMEQKAYLAAQAQVVVDNPPAT